MRFRNETKAFSGSFDLQECDDAHLVIRRECGGDEAVLRADFVNKSFEITHNGRQISL
ncbi:hypothetical protein [Lachnoclostridium sp. Marseille-P6806]|uniref:hypothetical protein n=1 Tax=Lachnoclostridium sp. Marseille-P6806 TaxID=2364793 RepID=UPI0013EF151F|nr:hypothetical protein [Lachnoclostridium sp. Marseille-P6806]